jgi:hypothetical protein
MGWIKSVGSKKVNNHPAARASKIELRRKVLEAVPDPSVFDAFAGSGRMYAQVWSEAKRYVGCDLKWYPDDRMAFVADNRRVLRSVDLQGFNIFDFDAYGSPWEQCLILAARRNVEPGETIGVLLTDGAGLNMKMGGMPLALREIAGFSSNVAGGARLQDEIVDRAILGLCSRLKCDLVHRWQATGKTGAKVLYNALVLRGMELPNT